MRLSDACGAAALDVQRNGEFQSLGLLSHRAPQQLVMWYDPRFFETLAANQNISCVITSPGLASQVPPSLGMAVCEDPQSAFYRIHEHLLAETHFYGPAFDSLIAPTAVIHETAYVSSHNVRIGSGTHIGPLAVVLDRSDIGKDCVIGPGVVVGGEGFEPKYVNGRHVIVRHAGGVRIGDCVEIQANSHVAKAVFNGATEIGDETKIDALVQIAHNVRMGKRCEVAASAVVAGSATIGDAVWIGPNAVISSEVKIGNRAFIAINSLVLYDVADDARVIGIAPRKRN